MPGAVALPRIDELFPLLSPKCRGEMRIIAFISDPLTLRAHLADLGHLADRANIRHGRSLCLVLAVVGRSRTKGIDPLRCPLRDADRVAIKGGFA